MSSKGLQGLSIRRAALLVLLYSAFFGIPELVLRLHLGLDFWFVVLASLWLGLYAFRYGSHMMQFYFVFFVFTLLFGYFIQFFVGIHFIIGLNYPNVIGPTTAMVLIMHFVGLTFGAILYGRPKFFREPLFFKRQSDSFLVGLFITIALITIGIWLGGAERMFGSRNAALDTHTSALGIFAVFTAKAAVFVYSASILNITRTPISLKNKGILLCFLILALTVSNPINTPRFICLTGSVLLFFVYISRTNRSKYTLSFLAITPLLALVTLPITSLMRHGLSDISLRNVFSIYSGLGMSSIQVLIDGVREATHLTSENYILSGLFVIIPKSLFTTKAPALGPTIASMSNYVFANTAVPSFFTGYVDLGVFGVFLVSCILGFCFQFSHISDQVNFHRRRNGYGMILFACTPIIARGDLSTAMLSFYAFMIPYELIRFSTKLSLRPAASKV